MGGLRTETLRWQQCLIRGAAFQVASSAHLMTGTSSNWLLLWDQYIMGVSVKGRIRIAGSCRQIKSAVWLSMSPYFNWGGHLLHEPPQRHPPLVTWDTVPGLSQTWIGDVSPFHLAPFDLPFRAYLHVWKATHDTNYHNDTSSCKYLNTSLAWPHDISITNGSLFRTRLDHLKIIICCLKEEKGVIEVAVGMCMVRHKPMLLTSNVQLLGLGSGEIIF